MERPTIDLPNLFVDYLFAEKHIGEYRRSNDALRATYKFAQVHNLPEDMTKEVFERVKYVLS